jgi:hypothetical protein
MMYSSVVWHTGVASDGWRGQTKRACDACVSRTMGMAVKGGGAGEGGPR